MSDEDKFDTILKEITTMKTIIVEVLKPAVSQTYTNKDDIAHIRGKVRIGQYITCGFVLVIIKSIYSIITKHPPTLPPHVH